MESPSPDVRARLMAQLASRPSPPRPQAKRRRLLLLALAALLPIVAAGMRGIAWDGRPQSLVLVSFAAAVAVAAAGTWWALTPGPSTLGRPRPWLRVAALAIPAILMVVATIGAVVWPETQLDLSLDPRAHIPCFAMTFLLAAAPFAVMMYLERRSDPVDPSATGAALGASAGAWAGVTVTLGCAKSHLLHIGLAHVLPLVGLAVLGAIVGSRVIGMRSDPQGH
ncbi:MAG: hypothetical protein CVU63_14180 [Deltaproteobacteria bacterium HGW-Deltaproteobacteria-20]|nr:MAG: hypothetical protein CVU63_14180 [Deltaproteobacteria bacterium HGW-Deltaproteobacteria-20]